MIKNRIVVIEKSTNEDRTFVLFSCVNLYTFKNLFDIIGTVTRTNSKNMTGPEVSIFRYFRVLFYPQILVNNPASVSLLSGDRKPQIHF